MTDLQWLTAVSGTAGNAVAAYNSIGLKLGRTAIKSVKPVGGQPDKRFAFGVEEKKKWIYFSASAGRKAAAHNQTHSGKAAAADSPPLDDLYLVHIITFEPAANNDKSLSVSPQRHQAERRFV